MKKNPELKESIRMMSSPRTGIEINKLRKEGKRMGTDETVEDIERKITIYKI